MNISWSRFLNPFHYLRLLAREFASVIFELKPPQPKPIPVDYKEVLKQRILTTKLKHIDTLMQHIHYTHELSKVRATLEEYEKLLDTAEIDSAVEAGDIIRHVMKDHSYSSAVVESSPEGDIKIIDLLDSDPHN